MDCVELSSKQAPRRMLITIILPKLKILHIWKKKKLQVLIVAFSFPHFFYVSQSYFLHNFVQLVYLQKKSSFLKKMWMILKQMLFIIQP